MPSLFVIRGRDQGKHFPVQQTPERIGRDPTNPIQLTDTEVSRVHAEIRTTEQGYELVDLDSSNGTLVNGTKISRGKLRSGDRVQIGQTIMIFTAGSVTDSMLAAQSVDILPTTQGADFSRIVSSWSPSSLVRGRMIGGEGEETHEFHPRESVDSRSLDVMYETAIAVGRTMDIPDLLDRILRLVFDWVEADRGCIMLRDPATGQLRVAARCDRRSNLAQPMDSSANRMAISRTILDFVIDRREGVRTSDAREDQRWDSAQSIVQMGIREALCVPLLGRYDCVGALYVDTFIPGGQVALHAPQSRFSDEHLRLMIAIGHQAALAIEDTYYYSSLLQSERLAAIGQTIAILSHHIKNILQGMRGGSYLIEAGLERNDPDAIRRGWKTVEKNQERISHLVLDMLSYSKERQPERTRGNLNSTIAEVAELLETRAQDQGCTLLLELEPQLPDSFFDSEGMHRAVLNLLTNALDAVAETPDPQITVRSFYSPQEGWGIEVDDNGPGIDPENREKIFSLFASSKGNRGTGLGLPVSQKIIAEHGGRIELSGKPSPGCRFRLTLPPPASTPDDFLDRETLI